MESTYSDRFWSMWHLCGPGSWKYLLSTAADLDDAKDVLKLAANGQDVQQEKLLHAQRLSASVLHPDTGEPILLPFRMAAHVPVNALLLWAMLSARTVPGTALAQWANQSFNAMQFYANKNSSGGQEVDSETIFASYLGAVTSSVAVAAALKGAFLRAEQQATAGTRLARLVAIGSASVPFLGAAAGKPLQIGLMRQDEWRQGVVVYDGEGKEKGRSIEAGRTAVGLTIATRTLYLAPMLWMPVVQSALERAVPLLHRSRTAAAVSWVLHSALNSAIVTPACIALFDQRTSLPASSLEPHFQEQGVPTYYFNKGL